MGPDAKSSRVHAATIIAGPATIEELPWVFGGGTILPSSAQLPPRKYAAEVTVLWSAVA